MAGRLWYDFKISVVKLQSINVVFRVCLNLSKSLVYRFLICLTGKR